MLSAAHGVMYVIVQSVTADKINDKDGVLMLDTLYVFSLAIFALAYLWRIRKKGMVSPIMIGLLLSFVFSLALLVFKKSRMGCEFYCWSVRYYSRCKMGLVYLGRISTEE